MKEIKSRVGFFFFLWCLHRPRDQCTMNYEWPHDLEASMLTGKPVGQPICLFVICRVCFCSVYFDGSFRFLQNCFSSTLTRKENTVVEHNGWNCSPLSSSDFFETCFREWVWLGIEHRFYRKICPALLLFLWKLLFFAI